MLELSSMLMLDALATDLTALRLLDAVFGGTSAVAPLFAGLIARLNQQRGRALGFINPELYANYQHDSCPISLHDISEGNNITLANNLGYQACQGWDACTGLGVPRYNPKKQK